MNPTPNKTASAATDLRSFLPRDRLTKQILSSRNNLFWIGAPKGMGKTVLLEQLAQQLAQRSAAANVLLITLTEGKGLDFVLRNLREHVLRFAPKRRNEPASISMADILNSWNGEQVNAEPLHLMIDGLDTRQHTSLIHYLIEFSRTLSGNTKLYLAVDDFLPQQHCHLSELYGQAQIQYVSQHDLRMTQAEIEALHEQRQQADKQKTPDWIIQKSDGIPSVLSLLIEHRKATPPEQCQILSQWIEQNFLLYLEPMEVLRLASLAILSQFNLKQASQLIGIAEDATLDWLLRYKPLLFRYSDDQTHFVWSQLMQPYFFHCLLHRYRDLLPKILKRSEPWLTDSNINPVCLDYLISSLEKDWAQDILVSKCRSWFSQRNPAAIIHLAERIPTTQCLSIPLLSLYYGWALILQKQTAEAHDWLNRLEEHLTRTGLITQAEDITAELFVLRALAGVFAQPRPTYHSRTALLESCLDKGRLFQGEVLSLYTKMLHAVGASGVSRNAIKKAIQFHQANQNLSHLSHAKTLYWRRQFNEGDTEKTIAETSHYLNGLTQGKPDTNSLPDTPPAERQAIAMVQSCLADFLYESNQLAVAKPLYHCAIPELIDSEWEYESVVAQVGLTRLYISAGDHQAALEEIERIKSRVRQRENTTLNPVLCFETMRVLRAQGRSVLPAASEYELDINHLSIESLFKHQHDKERLYWIKCYILILLEQGNFTSALIYAVKGLIKSLNLMDNRYRTLFSAIKALCEIKLGQQEDARKSITEAVYLAQQHNFIRTLINDDFGWRAVWHSVDKQQGFGAEVIPSFISELRTYLQQDCTDSATINSCQAQITEHSNEIPYRKLGLTDKEYEILKLLAEGLCNKTIASRSEIALTTVKWHLQNIFGKLNAKNRTEAVVRAQEYSLIGKNEPGC